MSVHANGGAPFLLQAPADWDGAPLFVRTFRIPVDHGRIVRATLQVTGEGIVEPFLDGERIGRDLLSPGWTSYEWRLRIIAHDLTTHLHPDREYELALRGGHGWACGRLGWMGAQRVYAERPGVWAVLDIEFEDGFRSSLQTDADWRVTRSTVISDDLYDGQTSDLRRDRGEPASPITVALDQGRLVRTADPLVVRHEQIAPVSVTATATGVLLDFGQNLVGWVRLRVRGPAGHHLVLRHTEVLEHGDLAIRPLRSARATDTVILTGGLDEFEPTLTFHGFRYVHIDGWHAVDGDATAVVIGSELRRTGWFACSDPILDRFHRNVVWSLRGNTVSIPSDCPQRDERLGWTGDIAVFAPTASFLFDMSGFLGGWLADLRAEQAAAGGRVPYVVPDPLKGWAVTPGESPESTGLWSDAACWVPWALWEADGDRAALEHSYPSMVAHIEHVLGRLSTRGIWEGDFQFGDWLDPTAPPEDPFRAIADPDAIATAAFHRSIVIAADTAAILDKWDDAARWFACAERLREAFTACYGTPEGRLASDAPALYALAIVSGIVRGDAAQAAGDRLAELVRAASHRVIAGFAGAPYLCAALSRTGHDEDAMRLLLNRAHPSWLHPIELGATTVWERWDSLRDDGTVNPGEMTSFNHYALGAVADWMHRRLLGIDPLEPGYAAVRIDPLVPSRAIAPTLDWVVGAYEAPSGLIGVAWRASPTVEVIYCAPSGVRLELCGYAATRGRRVSDRVFRRLLASVSSRRGLLGSHTTAGR